MSGFGYLDEIKGLEHSTLKVPYETLNKQYRNVQKSIDRDCCSISQTVVATEKQMKSNDLGRAEILSSFTAIAEKLRSLKKRSNDYRNEEKDLLKLIKKRIDHLKDHESQSVAVNKNFRKARFDRVLIDYFLRSGFYRTAQIMADKSGIQDMTNIDIFLIEKDIVESLKNKETAKCFSWCNENKSKLKKINSNLEFTLRQQEFIELVRAQRCVEAVHHARKYFINLNATQLIDVQKSMVLLAYVKSTDASTYQELLNEDRWTQIIDLFKQENYKIHQLPEQSSFTAILQAGLSAMKTPTCYRKVTSVKNPNCPVCHPSLNAIARPLPYAICNNSKLICAFSGAAMNENNVPMMLPNGMVYSINSLLQMMSDNDGRIKCPRTNELFEFHEAQKVFIL